MQIWIYINGMQQGPYTLEQLRMMGLDPSTPVWYDGLAQWMPAAQAPATSGLFGQSDIQEEPRRTFERNYDTQSPSGESHAKPKSFLVWNIIFTVLCCCPLALAGIITGAIGQSRYNSGDFKGAKNMSDATEWLFILTIVWIVVSAPVSVIMSCL